MKGVKKRLLGGLLVTGMRQLVKSNPTKLQEKQQWRRLQKLIKKL
jgi:hypothetical protein